MSWSWYSQLTDSFKRRAGRYLINRYLGPFLEEGILLDQLTVDGCIRLRNVAVNTDHINEHLADTEAPIEFVDGFIQELAVTVPWSNLLKENCFFEVKGLTITCQVKKRAHPSQLSASIFHSMCESFSSKDMAEDCLRQNDVVDDSPCKTSGPTNPGVSQGISDETVLGVDMLAQAIDSIIRRVQISFLDTTLRIEYIPTVAPRGLAFEFKIKTLKYSGEDSDQEDNLKPAMMTSSTLKKIFFEDVTLLTDEFSFQRSENEMGRSSRCDSSRESESSSETTGDDNEDNVKPLKVGSLIGRQEMVLRFVDTDHYGLPRSVEEIEFNLGACILHAYPHQIHALTEIVSALAAASNGSPQEDNVNVKDSRSDRSFMDNPRLRFGLETMLQDSMYHKPILGMETKWSTAGPADSITQSSEFQPMPRVGIAKKHTMDTSVSSSVTVEKDVTPTINIKLASLICVLIEKDEGIAKLGGESSRVLAHKLMTKKAEAFFKIEPPNFTGIWDSYRQLTYHAKIEQVCNSSRLQIIAAPLTVVYEEGSLSDTTFGVNFLMKLTMSIGRLSMKEAIVAPPGSPHASNNIDMITFTDSGSSDFKLIYEEVPDEESHMKAKTKASLKILLSPCNVTIDPGFYDRIYCLLFYNEMDPNCLVTPAISLLHDDEELVVSGLSVILTCPQLHLNFYVPKVDMRKASEMTTEEFVELFWARKIHPELFQLRLRQFEMRLKQDAGPKSPLSISLSSDFMDILFKENEDSEKLPIAVVRKSQRFAEDPLKKAVKISIVLNMDETQQLQGRFDSTEKTRNKSRSLDASEHFFGGASGISGDTRSGGFQRGNQMIDEQINIKSALAHAINHNNIMIDIHLDEVSLVLPTKHLYELIYNRLGNDMLLWLPAIFNVMDVLYNQPIVDPLRDPDQDFSHKFSNKIVNENILAIEQQQHCAEGEQEFDHDDAMTGSIYDSFPRQDSKVPGAITIHTDTFVSLNINKGHVTISSPLKTEEEVDDDGGVYFFIGEIKKLKLLTAVGLERDPEICLLSTSVQDAKLSFGPSIVLNSTCNSHDFAAKLHFNQYPSPKVLPLFRSTDFITRAWPNSHSTDLLQLTTKILFDSKSNFKSINLAMFLTEGSFVASSPSSQSVLVDWLTDFFTVVEYPVMGYVPPAILTEMHFDAKQCTVDVTYLQPGQITLTMGHARVNCRLLDTGADVSITVSAEDIGLFVSKNETAVSHLKSSICILDTDSVDVSVNLREKPAPILDVSLAGQLLRIRTCNDTIQLLTDFATSIPAVVQGQSLNSTRENSAQREDASAAASNQRQQVSDDVVPDLADAMAELDMMENNAHTSSKQDKEVGNTTTHAERGKSKVAKTKGGAQVFFFPDENQQIQALQNIGMTESVYVQQYCHQEAQSDDDFCILDDIGSGFGNKPSEPCVKVLDPSGSISLVENHFALAKEKANRAIDYLKTPKGFPKFQARITLKNLSVLWQLYGGQDFGVVTQESVSTTSTSSRSKDQWNNSIEGLKCRGGPKRKTDQLLEVFLSKISAQHELYPDTAREASRQILIINNFEVRDKIESSDINKLLHLYSNKLRPRQSNANMFSIKVVNLRPDPDMPQAEESVVNVSLQPIRINIDQETLFFLIDFCTSFIPPQKEKILHSQSSNSVSIESNTTVRYSHGVETIEIQPDEVAIEVTEEDQEPPAEEDLIFEEPPVIHGTRSEDAMYIRSFTFARDVPIRIDYSAKYMDLAHGAVAGILSGLTSLNCSELTLKKVHYRNGISGLDKLITLLVTEWLTDIRQNQIPRILGGVGPMHSFLQLVQGFKDLFMMPVEQYQKDGRILRGIQKGAHSFTSSTAMSLLDFTNKLLGVIKFAAEMAFDIMSPETSVVQGKLPHPNINRNAIRRPADMREGMFNALAIVQEGLEETARTVILNVLEDHNRRGLSGAVGGIIRQVPSNLVRPVILATTATSNVLEGVKNQVAPESRKEEEEKWKNTS